MKGAAIVYKKVMLPSLPPVEVSYPWESLFYKESTHPKMSQYHKIPKIINMVINPLSLLDLSDKAFESVVIQS